MTALNPAQDRVDVFNVETQSHAEATPFTLVKSALEAGVGIALTYNADSGKLKITNTLPEDGGAGGGTPIYARVPFAAAAGTATAITLDFTPDVSAPGAGDPVAFTLAYTIAGATTVTPDGIDTYPLVDANGAELTVNFGLAGELMVAIFDGAKYRVINKPPQSLSGTPTLMTPGAIGALALGIINFNNAPSTYGPAVGYLYGSAVTTWQGYNGVGSSDVASVGTTYSGTWRILSRVAHNDPSTEYVIATALAQRIS